MLWLSLSCPASNRLQLANISALLAWLLRETVRCQLTSWKGLEWSLPLMREQMVRSCHLQRCTCSFHLFFTLIKFRPISICQCKFKLSIHFQVGHTLTVVPLFVISLFYLGLFAFGQWLAVLRNVSGLDPQFFPALPVLPAENLEGQLNLAFVKRFLKQPAIIL